MHVAHAALRARAAPAAPKLAVPSTSRVQRCRTSALPSDATPGPLASLTQALAAVPKVAMVPLAVMVLLGSTGGALAKDEGTLDTLTGGCSDAVQRSCCLPHAKLGTV